MSASRDSGKSFTGLFQLLEVVYISWLMAASLQPLLPLAFLLICYPPASFLQELFDDIGPTHIIQAHLFTSGSFI